MHDGARRAGRALLAPLLFQPKIRLHQQHQRHHHHRVLLQRLHMHFHNNRNMAPVLSM